MFTKKQDTASVLKEMLTGMKEAKDSVVNKVKRVKKEPNQIIKEEPVRVIEPAKPEPKIGVANEETGHPRGKPPKEKNIEPEKLETGE